VSSFYQNNDRFPAKQEIANMAFLVSEVNHLFPADFASVHPKSVVKKVKNLS
jgi:hypothetical protein